MRIDGNQWQTLTKALVKFPLSQFDRMLRFELNKDREEIALGDDKTTIVFRVIEHYDFRNQVELLVNAARNYNPTDDNLYIIAMQWGLAPQEIDRVVYDNQGQPTVEKVEPLRLERVVRKINPLLDVEVWVPKLLANHYRICRVEDDQQRGVGTGFLVGPKTVMTNYHVVKDFIDPADGTLREGSLRLRFDYSVAPDGVTTPGGTVYEIMSLLDTSPMSPFEDNPNPPQDPTANELDYALLLVDGAPGNDPVGGKPKSNNPDDRQNRGWVTRPTKAYDFAPDAPLLIYQHTDGGTLKLAIETNAIAGVNNSKTRVRYRTNTDGGASGSPCFDMDWNLVALHHAGGVHNQGIPFNLILDALTAKSMLGFLG